MYHVYIYIHTSERMVLVLLCFEPFVQNCDAGFRDFVSLRYFLATLLMLEFARWIQVSAKGGCFLLSFQPRE